MRFYRKIMFALVTITLSHSTVFGQLLGKDSIEGYRFTVIKELPHTSIKNQHRSGTCWSFSGLSFLESEMLRMGKPEVDLSEMFVVWHTYFEKAVKYVRMHGDLNFGAGGAFHDVTNMIRRYGMVPESVFPGLNYGEDKHTHGELDELLKGYIDGVIKNKNKKLSPVWLDGYRAILDTYLGQFPAEFEYEGNIYTPHSFLTDYCGINPDDYVELTSYTHHPFYGKFILEVPDNWMYDEVYNLPLDELEEVIDYAIENGYSVAWAADVSEKGFDSKRTGVAVVPEIEKVEMSDSEISRWERMSDSEKFSMQLKTPGNEKIINQEMRQVAFDNYETTDDHGVHIIGTAKDQKGNLYSIVKNSWGDHNRYHGKFYASKPYVRYKTMCIMVHKDAIPKSIQKKLQIQ